MKIMKKILLCTLCSLALTAQAQQINGDFDGEWEDCVPWESSGNTKVVGSQPQGWRVSSVTGMGIYSQVVAEKVEGKNGVGSALKLTNKSALGNGIPAYVTLGTPWATSTGMFTITNADGGTWGGISFSYKPDALSFDYKMNASASVVAYLWNGTWQQKDVPGVVASRNPTKVNMENRDRNILGLPTSQGGDIISSGTLLASVNEVMTENTGDDWKTAVFAFSYKDVEATASMLNVVLSANDYFGERSNIKADDYLIVDNVKLVYYHSLLSCEYNGQVVLFNENKETNVYEAIVNDVFDASKLVYEKKGVGAEVENPVYDPSTGKLTITVKGNDYEVNKESVTTYTIQFEKPEDVKSTKDYTEELYVTIDGQTVGPQSTPVTVQTRYDGKINFLLKNFALGDMYIGNINVDGLDVEDGKFSCQDKSIVITAGDLEGVDENQWMGPTLSQMGVKANMEGCFVGDNNIKVSLSILFGGMNINVHLGYTPTIANMAVGANKYGTFYAPFAVTLPGDVKAYTCESLNNGSTLVLTSVDGGEIPSNTAVIVESTNGTSQDFYNFEEGLKVEDGNTGLLHGVATGGKAPRGSYVLQTQEGKGQKFYLVTTDNLQVSANRCYLQLPASSGVKAISFPSDPTAIDGVKELLSGKAEIYDLEGRRLPALQKGINIVGGKKVMVK